MHIYHLLYTSYYLHIYYLLNFLMVQKVDSNLLL